MDAVISGYSDYEVAGDGLLNRDAAGGWFAAGDGIFQNFALV